MTLARLPSVLPVDSTPLFIAGASASHAHVRHAFQSLGYVYTHFAMHDFDVANSLMDHALFDDSYTIVTKEELYPAIRQQFGSNELALIDAGKSMQHAVYS
jgi:cobalamin-dependent methionine synthase I